MILPTESDPDPVAIAAAVAQYGINKVSVVKTVGLLWRIDAGNYSNDGYGYDSIRVLNASLPRAIEMLVAAAKCSASPEL